MDFQKLADVIVGGRVNMCFGAWRLSERQSRWHSACREQGIDTDRRKDAGKTNYRIINNEKAEN